MKPCTAKRLTSNATSNFICHVAAPRRLHSRSEIVVRRGKGNKTRVVKIGKD